MRRTLVLGLLGGVVLFLWGTISWVALPFHNATMRAIPNGEVVAAALQANITEKGVYYYPPQMQADGGENAQWVDQWKRGPVVTQLVYLAPGENPMMASSFVRYFLYGAIASALVAWMMQLAAGALATFGKRVLFATAIGALLALMGPFTEANWWHYPLGFTLVNAADSLIGWTLVGVLFAWRMQAAERSVPGYSPVMTSSERRASV